MENNTVHRFPEGSCAHVECVRIHAASQITAVASSTLCGQTWSGRVTLLARNDASPTATSPTATSPTATSPAATSPNDWSTLPIDLIGRSGFTSLAWLSHGDKTILAAGADDGCIYTHTFAGDALASLVAPLLGAAAAKGAKGAKGAKSAKAAVTETLKRTLVAHDDAVLGLDAHPTRQGLLLSGGADGSVRIWELPANSQPTKIVNAHVSKVTQVQWHPSDGNKYLSVSQDGFVRVWDMTKTATLLNYDAGCPLTTAVWNPQNPNIIAIGTESGEVKLLDIETKAVTTVAVHEFSIGCLAYSQSGDVLASGGDDFSIQIIDSKSNTKKTITHHTDFVRTLVWTGPQESPSLVSGSWDYSIALHTGLLFGNLDQAN